MSFIDIPTEQTTSITDLVLAAQAFSARYYLRRGTMRPTFWSEIWSWIFSLLALASLLGAVAHGFEMSADMNAALWIPLYLVLGLTVALFAVAAASHRWDDAVARRLLPASVGIALAFFATTQIWSDSFLLFVAYEGLAMVVALALYASCLWCSAPRRGSGFLAAGVLIGLLAAAVDTQSGLRVRLFWEFDNHGMFHLVQLISLSLLTIGIYRSQSAGEARCPFRNEVRTDTESTRVSPSSV